MSILMILLTLAVLAAVPLWVFWDDMAASRRGMTYMEYLDHRIDALTKRVVDDQIKKASYLHPRPMGAIAKAKSHGVVGGFCVVFMLFLDAYASPHLWSRILFAAGLGGSIGSFALALWFLYKAHRGARKTQ